MNQQYMQVIGIHAGGHQTFVRIAHHVCVLLITEVVDIHIFSL